MASIGEVKNWASILDESTRKQAAMLSRAPSVAGHVALMPDAHLGKGATVGSVFPTYIDTIIPAAVGVDIGCGMIGVRTNKTISDIAGDLTTLLQMFGNSIPAGVGGEHGVSNRNPRSPRWKRALQWFKANPLPFPKDFDQAKAQRQLGTLGAGNHFVEVCLNNENRIVVTVHSGSRGIGNHIARMFIRLAQEESKESLENPDLAGLRGPSFEKYIAMMEWAQLYAFTNREFMMDAAIEDLRTLIPGVKEEERINCHHNFAALEVHFGKEVWLTRKGAIKADVGDLGIIPGSMSTPTYITTGLGNPESYKSSSHGAGRKYSRNVARRTFTIDSLNKYMEGKAWNSDDASLLLDEHPGAYKPIDQVMEDQEDLTQVVDTLNQIVNYKGT